MMGGVGSGHTKWTTLPQRGPAKKILLISKRVRKSLVATFVENQRRSQPTTG